MDATLHNHRSDTTDYGARSQVSISIRSGRASKQRARPPPQSPLTPPPQRPLAVPWRCQELPAVYSNGPYYRLLTTEGGELKEYNAGWDSSNSFPWVPGAFTADEHWAALVDESGWGMGVVNLDTTDFIGGFSGEKVRFVEGKKVSTPWAEAVNPPQEPSTEPMNGLACSWVMAHSSTRCWASRIRHPWFF